MGSRPYKTFDEHDMEDAINAVESGEMTQKEACFAFGVKTATLSFRLQRTVA